MCRAHRGQQTPEELKLWLEVLPNQRVEMHPSRKPTKEPGVWCAASAAQDTEEAGTRKRTAVGYDGTRTEQDRPQNRNRHGHGRTGHS